MPEGRWVTTKHGQRVFIGDGPPGKRKVAVAQPMRPHGQMVGKPTGVGGTYGEQTYYVDGSWTSRGREGAQLHRFSETVKAGSSDQARAKIERKYKRRNATDVHIVTIYARGAHDVGGPKTDAERRRSRPPTSRDLERRHDLTSD